MTGLTCNTTGLVAFVIDDEANVRLFARATLESIGFEVVEAAAGEEGLELLEQLRPDVVLLDVLMPGIDGYEVCERLRALPDFENLPILMMTGLDDLESINRAYDAGATDFLVKPLNWALVKHRVRYTIRSSIALRSLANAQRIARTGSWEATGIEAETSCSDETYRVLGVGRSPGLSLHDLLANVKEADRDRVEAARRAALETGLAYEVEYAISDAEGERFIHEQGRVTGAGTRRRVVGTVQDITQRRRFEEQITFVAHHDSLTGLPNRRLFKERLAEAVAAAGRRDRRVAVLYFDLDAFKRVNDTFGHSVGDRILRAVATRVRGCIRTEDVVARENDQTMTVSRLGGDEFTVLLSDVGAPEEAAVVAERILERLGRPYTVQDTTLRITPSIGITVYPDDGATVEALLRNADLAMYQAKRAGRNNYRFFTPELQARARKRIVLESALESALEQGALHLSYQPIFDAARGTVDEVEALIRWQDETLGEVTPEELIPVAEQTGMIVPIGEWLLRTACEQFKEWRPLRSAPARLALNVSVVQLRREDFPDRVNAILEELDFDPHDLQLEITESVLMNDVDASEQILEGLQALGVTVAIDDFGTGYSSLSYLRRIRPDVLKIDRSFVVDIDRDPKGGAIIAAIIAMAHALGVRVTAEGVETEAQLEFLRRSGCDAIQGFLLARPGTPDDVRAVLETTPLQLRQPVRSRAALGGG